MSISDDTIIDHLEELAEKFGIEIRHEIIRQEEDLSFVAGGLCLFKGEYVLIINPNANEKDKIRILLEAVKHFDLDQVFIRPVLRELLDKIPDQGLLRKIDEHG